MAEIKFTASVYKVQTLANDLGIRVTLDLPEDCIPQMAMLAETKREGIPLIFVATVAPEKQEQSERLDIGKISAGAIRKSSRATA